MKENWERRNKKNERKRKTLGKIKGGKRKIKKGGREQ